MTTTAQRSWRVLERALREVAEPVGPHSLLREGAAAPGRSRPTPAAVLVPIALGVDRPELLLTVRHSALRSHPGQISFPGGRVDPEDLDVAATAVRETHEEVGVAPAAIEVIGALGPYLTGTGYSVVPVIGLIPAGYPYRLARDEVEEVFHVPLEFLFETGTWETREYEIEGGRRSYAEIWFGRYRIWGATAGMIVDLRDRLRRHASRDPREGPEPNCACN